MRRMIWICAFCACSTTLLRMTRPIIWLMNIVTNLIISMIKQMRMIMIEFWDSKIRPRHAKTCLRAYRTAKAQISLRIRAVWSGPSLSANRITGSFRMYQCLRNATNETCTCVGWIWICAFSHARRHIATWPGPVICASVDCAVSCLSLLILVPWERCAPWLWHCLGNFTYIVGQRNR